ncbi:MAG: hypothetical protein RLZZ74_2656 [Cyanobacteriota bacterium]|jgi:hypothetical protein
MQMLKKLFNSESKYHLELDETESSEVVPAAVKPAEKATAATTQDNGTPAIASNSKSGKTKSAKASAKGKGKEVKQVVKATAKNSAASSYEPPFWVAAMNNTNNNGSSNGSGQGGEVTFASDNLMPTVSKYRRLPGGSLAKFRDMAKTAKTPRK